MELKYSSHIDHPELGKTRTANFLAIAILWSTHVKQLVAISDG